MPNYSAGVLREQIEVVLRRWGMPEDKVAITATVMIDTDLSGIDSHGISMLMNYDRMVSESLVNITANAAVITETPAVAVLDAGGGLGHPVAVEAMERAVAKARDLGVGAVAVCNSHHFGAAGYYVRLAAAQGLVGLATTTARSVAVIPTGAASPALGTNPLAFAAPNAGGEPFVLDMSTSTVAMNKVKSYALKEAPLPDGWVVDGGGNSLRDAAAAYETLRTRGEGGLVPLGGSTSQTGGHKGYGLSMMVQILSAALSNAALPGRSGAEGDNIGHFFLAIDPEIFNPGGKMADYVADLVDIMHGSQAVDAHGPVLVAGEPEARSRLDRALNGIPVPDLLLQNLRDICARNDVPFLLDEKAAAL